MRRLKRWAWSFAIASFTLATPALTAGAQTVTELLRSGPNGSKLNLVVIGDGFAAADQAAYNTFVDNMVVRGVFDEARDGVFRETMNAYNLFRVNANSQQSGITLVDSTGTVTTQVNTFLGYRYSGIWGRCWMEESPTTLTTLQTTLDNLVPGWTYAFVVLNTPQWGGCARGNRVAVTLAGSWTISAHELGHMVGALADEYTGGNTWTGGEPSAVNLTINTDRATLKWRAFVNPGTVLPTPTNFTGHAVNDAGLFAGGAGNFNAGVFRPGLNDRMTGNTPEFDPVCYDQMQRQAEPRHEYTFRNVYAGRFSGANRSDVMLHNANSIALFTGAASQIEPAWVRTMPDPVWDDYRAGDKFLVGDFDGDGKDDLFVYNFVDWSIPYFAMLRSTGSRFEGVRRFDQNLPGWGAMTPADEFHVADFDADGKDDIVVFNGRDFSIGYLLMLRSTGTTLTFVKRFDNVLPGWGAMKRNDRFHVADFDADNRDDLYVFNGRDWSIGYLEMLRSTGSNLAFVKRFDQKLPGWDDMRPNDEFFVGDFDGDKRKDLYVFNGPDWSMSYLEMLRSTGTTMTNTRRFDRNVPGWGEMRRHDRWFPADVDGNGRTDLYVYNSNDWSMEYLGTLASSGISLSGGFQGDWIGSWNLGGVDQFRVANFNGAAGWDDLLVFNENWFGLLRSVVSATTLSAIYPKWIHNHNYHSAGWW